MSRPLTLADYHRRRVKQSYGIPALRRLSERGNPEAERLLADCSAIPHANLRSRILWFDMPISDTYNPVSFSE